MNARYLIDGPTWVRERPGGPGVYHDAHRTHPVAIEIDERVVPSRTWKPLDERARKALAAIGVEAEIVKEP